MPNFYKLHKFINVKWAWITESLLFLSNYHKQTNKRLSTKWSENPQWKPKVVITREII